MCTQNRTLSANMHFMLSKKASNEPQFLTRKKREIQLNKKKSIKANVSKRNNAFSHSCRIENNWLERRAKRMKRMEWIFYPFRPSNVGIWQCSRSNSCIFKCILAIVSSRNHQTLILTAIQLDARHVRTPHTSASQPVNEYFVSSLRLIIRDVHAINKRCTNCAIQQGTLLISLTSAWDIRSVWQSCRFSVCDYFYRMIHISIGFHNSFVYFSFATVNCILLPLWIIRNKQLIHFLLLFFFRSIFLFN